MLPAQPDARDVERDLLVEGVEVGLPILLEVPDVLPVALAHVAVHRPSELEQPREELLREVERTVVGNVPKHPGVEDVDAGVDRVREHLAPRGLLQEALDAPVLSRDDDAEVERVVDCLERDRHGSFAFGVEAHQRRQVEVGERVARDDEERLVESFSQQAAPTRRPHRRRLQRVVDGGAERSPSPKYDSIAWGRKARVTVMSVSPCAHSRSTMCSMHGFPTTGTIGFGWFEVSGRSRVPSPPP